MSWNNVIPGWILERMFPQTEEEIRLQRERELESHWQYPLHRGCNSGLEDSYPDPDAVDDEDLW
jgi:hypothetical protein